MLVTQLGQTPLDAFSLMSYSLIPNFVEFQLNIGQEVGDGEEEGEEEQEGLEDM